MCGKLVRMISSSQLIRLESDVRTSKLSDSKKEQYLKWLSDMRHVNRALTYYQLPPTEVGGLFLSSVVERLKADSLPKDSVL